MARSNRRRNRIPDRIALEYEKAQDSAEHYNTMIWTLISVGLGLSLFILKFVWFESSILSGRDNSLIKVIALGLGSLSLFYFSYLIKSADRIKDMKYLICKDIEFNEEYKYKANLKTEVIKKRKGIWFSNIGVFLLFVLYLSSILWFGLDVLSFSSLDLQLKSFGVILIFLGTVGMFSINLYHLIIGQ